MNSIFMLINFLVLLLLIGGGVFLLVAVWRSMKALEAISHTIKGIHDKMT
jgi:hypothetical protein